jgi:2,3-bisphosphoglycerate-independent phosphoglycerate mutase
MKYIILVPDGVADEPVKALGGKTPLEAARTPHMDFLAKNGFSGLVQTIPDGMSPGSDVGNLSLLGYDPKGTLSGRAPLEAANLGIELKAGDIAFRCNLVNVKDGKMIDYSAGHISIDEAALIMKDIAAQLNDGRVTYYTGKSYRHICVIKTGGDVDPFQQVKCTPPHDILDQATEVYMPKGVKADIILDQMERSRAILKDHPVNLARIKAGKLPATMTWFWGQGERPPLQSYKERFGVSGSVISAVDLVNGIGCIVGLKIISVPGVTGYLDTNFRGKADYALASLKDNDFVFVHVEATDETGHNGDAKGKVEAVERFDADVVGPVLAWAKERDDVRILVSPDHPTPLEKRTHTSAPVPFVMYGKDIEPNRLDGYNEALASKAGLKFTSGEQMIEHFMGHKRKV